MVLATALYTPFRVAFIDDDTTATSVMDLMFNICFGIDMIINFNTGFYDDKKQLIIAYSLIAKEYLKFWFWIDFISM
jgi:hypothetical protein